MFQQESFRLKFLIALVNNDRDGREGERGDWFLLTVDKQWLAAIEHLRDFVGAMWLNITNKYGTFVQFIYLWDHPPTEHTLIFLANNAGRMFRRSSYENIFLVELSSFFLQSWPQRSPGQRMSELMIVRDVATSGQAGSLLARLLCQVKDN